MRIYKKKLFIDLKYISSQCHTSVYVLVAIIKKQLKLKQSLYTILGLMRKNVV
jgi:hypothetical protein